MHHSHSDISKVEEEFELLIADEDQTFIEENRHIFFDLAPR